MASDDEMIEEALAAMGLTVEADSCSFLEDSDDPAELQQCIERIRLGAWAAQRCRTERTVIAEVHVDPDRPLQARVIVSTPTGDRSHERDVAVSLMKVAVISAMSATWAVNVCAALNGLVAKVTANELSAADAWARVEAMLGEAASDAGVEPAAEDGSPEETGVNRTETTSR